MKKNILVFPCGSEVALEIYRSLQYSAHFNLIGANSVDDHGRFVFENYIGGVPFVDDPMLIPFLKQIVVQYRIDYIYPAMDRVITCLKEAEEELGCSVIGSSLFTARICMSKSVTYQKLQNVVRIPHVYEKEAVDKYPVFVKPIIGYGARGAKRIDDKTALILYLNEQPESIISEYLPGAEYTVDCFTDRHGNLLFWGPRERSRVSNGISVNTQPVAKTEEFRDFVEKINDVIKFRGAWFVQLKRNVDGDLTLLEIACRLGGSSALYRAKGINFAQLSLFDAMGCDVKVLENDYEVEMDRALDNKFKMSLVYEEVFIDYDDCLVLDGRYINPDAMKFICQCKNRNIRVTLLSRHDGDLMERLDHFGLTGLFDRIIHISKGELKSAYVDNNRSIFIDDSFAERSDIAQQVGIPVFSVDMLPMLIQ